MNWIKNNFLSAICLILIIIILLSECHHADSVNTHTVTITRDTILIHHDSVVVTAPQLVKQINWKHDTIFPTAEKWYTNEIDTSCNTQNIYKEVVQVDSIGFISVSDTVQGNLITGRKIGYNLHYPTITNTVTIYPPNKRQLFIGGGIGGYKSNIVDNIYLGALYKDRKGGVIGFNLGIDNNLRWRYSVGKYWLLKLK